MKKILFIGGDSRQQYAASYVADNGHSVSFVQNSTEIERAVAENEYIVLPLPVSRDGIRINAPLSTEPLTLAAVLRAIKPGQSVLAGMPPADFAEKAMRKGVTLYDYYQNEAMAILNSISTAEGTIYELIGNMKTDINGSEMLVIGYGKAGSAIAQRLVALGAHVRVAARSEKARALAKSRNCKAVQLYSIPEGFCDYDAVINTVPAPVAGEDFIQKLPKHCIMLEIASAPYGIDTEAAECHGIRVIRAPSLPGRISPKSAGEAIGEAILGVINE